MSYVLAVEAQSPGGISQATYSQPWQVQLPPQQAAPYVQLSSTYAPASTMPLASWPSVPGMQQYEVAVFSYPDYRQLTAWAATGETYTQMSGLPTYRNGTFVLGVQVKGVAGFSPVTYSQAWRAY
jgi:hypothetical protein